MPWTEDEELDRPALARLVDHCAAEGILEPVFCRVLAAWRSEDPEHVAVVQNHIVSLLGPEHVRR